jgi:hypothetical protein
MKLATLLNKRSDLQKTLKTLESRMQNNLLVQEGDAAQEPPHELIADYVDLSSEWAHVVKTINRINTQSRGPIEIDGASYDNLSEIIVERDRLTSIVNMYKKVLDGSVVRLGHFGSRNEIKQRVVLNVRDIRAEADAFAKRLRIIDEILQEFNWTIDVD